MKLINSRATVDEETGTVTLIWDVGMPPGYPDPVMWYPSEIVTLELPGQAVLPESTEELNDDEA